MVGMLLSGSCNTIVLKLQDEVKINGVKYQHPFFQCLVMFIGEFTCLGLYGIKLLAMKNKESGKDDKLMMSPGTREAEENELKTNINPLLLAIPATCDICGSTLMFVALTQVAASVY